ncbi:MAG: Asp-tRNA(Asn)/Glu-tRNA(Gln) amidotransferase subunit GatC [Planctomycetota bacterium]|nr:Asp-tRNA(Asn)/Glu-tRNA(Gln) amidotransferase subunit GatC [Planctomycetota bacterium]
MAIELTRDKVREVARLARLKLTDEEVETFTSQLGHVLEYVDILSEVNTDGVEPMAHAVEQFNVLRDDAVRESLPREAALANAPKTDGRYFQVPQILESS